jgi:hypothetical protein
MVVGSKMPGRLHWIVKRIIISSLLIFLAYLLWIISIRFWGGFSGWIPGMAVICVAAAIVTWIYQSPGETAYTVNKIDEDILDATERDFSEDRDSLNVSFSGFYQPSMRNYFGRFKHP